MFDTIPQEDFTDHIQCCAQPSSATTSEQEEGQMRHPINIVEESRKTQSGRRNEAAA